VRLADGTHLTYCTNIHAGEHWHEIQQNLESYVLAIKAKIAGNDPFGIGLRLSSCAATELLVTNTLKEFQSWLTLNNCYVFTINGFPYGNFYGEQVKENVYLPDWSDHERVIYTLNLARLMVALFPENLLEYGSISTVPVGFRKYFSKTESIGQAAQNLLWVVQELIALEKASNRRIVLALEPEPCCYLETIQETILFFNQYLLSPIAIGKISTAFSLDTLQAELEIRRHIGICLDLCHAAIEFEDPIEIIDQIQSANITIAKIQITNALRILSVNTSKVEILSTFANDIYLHQVVTKNGNKLDRYTDLPLAIHDFYSLASYGETEWRVHFHVPLFLNVLSILDTTQPFTRTVLERHRQAALTQHLEIETYTWSVLPRQYTQDNIIELIRKEYTWVRNILLS